MNHEFLQLVGALTTSAGFLIFLYLLLTSGFRLTPFLVFLAGIAILLLSKFVAKKDLERRRKKSKYLNSLDQKNKK